MAKDKVDVPSIQIGGNKPGLAFGGVIYSADSQVGYSGDPTKLNINVALDSQVSSNNLNKRQFEINRDHLNLASPVDVNFAGAPFFRNMFLNSYNISTSVDNKLLNLTYSDGSVLLDRIFVGLIHQHFNIGGYTQLDGDGNLTRDKYAVPNMIEMQLRCPAKELYSIKHGTTTWTYEACSATDYTLSNRKTFRHLANPTGNPIKPYLTIRADKKNIWSGGYIVLGSEEFTEAKCDIADVSYSFRDLINSIKGFGIRIDFSRYPDRRDNRFVRKNYSGTLKDVLQNWGSDLGITFYWDFFAQAPTLVVVDLSDRSIQAKFEYAIAGIDSLDRGNSDIIINEKNHENSLDGTFSQGFSSIMQRGPSAKDKNLRKTVPVMFSCQTLAALSAGPKVKKIMNRLDSSFLTSMMLGKYAPDLRDIFNVRSAIRSHHNTGGGWGRSSGYFNSLGFTDVIGITFGPESSAFAKGLKEKIIAHAGLTSIIAEHKNTFEQEEGELPTGPNGFQYDVFMGVYDEHIKEYISGVEQSIANDYYGKNFILSTPAAEFFQCNKLYKLLEKLTTKPNAEYYAANQYFKTPMAKFLEKLEDLRIDSLNESGKTHQSSLLREIVKLKLDLKELCEDDIFKKRRQHGFFHFNRQAPWMASKEDVDDLLNPWTLQNMNTVVMGENDIYYTQEQRPRVRKNIVKEYVPFMVDMPDLSQLAGDLWSKAIGSPNPSDLGLSKAYNIMANQQATGKSVMLCLVLRDGKGFGHPRRMGHIRVSPPIMRSNVIEEINALSSLCDRKNDVTPDDTDDCQTACEGDLAEELCSSDLFGQPSLSCGEAQAIKDSAYQTEMAAIKGKIQGQTLILSRSKPKRAGQALFADSLLGIVHPKVQITAPSENNHHGVLIYDRDMTVTDFGVQKVFDGLDTVQPRITPKISQLKYQIQDITQDVSSVFSEENRPKILEGELPLEIIVDLLGTVTEEGDTSYLTLQNIAADRYHRKIKNNLALTEVDTVREQVNYKIYLDGAAGLSGLVQYLKQENGLESLSITSDENGYYVSVSFSNRPPLVPTLDTIYRKVGPLAKAVQHKNVFLRSQ